MHRILIAEDEPDIRDLIALTLQFGGFEVITAVNGVEAVEKAKSEVPDLILLDVRMPRMTGYEACAAIKADETTAHIPLVFLSAEGQQDEVRSGLKVGAVDYILKPFAPDVLIKRVKELLASPTDGKPAADAGPKPSPQPNGEKQGGKTTESAGDTSVKPSPQP